MALTRDDILEYISGTFSELGVKLSQVFSDAPTTYKPVIDQVLKALHVSTPTSYAATASDDDLEKVYALAEYYTLQKLLKAAAAQIDINSDAPVLQGTRSQLFSHIRDLLKEAALRVEELGLDTSNYAVGVDIIRYSHDPYVYYPDEFRVLP
jgi:hypothetical protein